MKLCIDPGHGMASRKAGQYDPGACHGTHQEATYALIWSHALRCACEALGIPVYMTRTKRDDPAPLGQRVARAKAAGCTHFVSLHLNWSEDPKSNGVETVYEGTPQARFSEGIQNVLVSNLKLTNRKTKWASIDLKRTLAVLRFPGPCALLELGFITNAKDVERLLNPDVMHLTCAALAAHLQKLRA